MTREEYIAHIKQDEDAKQFYKEIGEQFGEVKFLGATKVSNSKVIILDNELACERVTRLAKYEWREWLLSGKPALRIEISLHQENRRLAQNSLYWKLVTETANQLADHMSGEYHSKRTWDEYFKERFLGVESVTFMGRPQHRTKPHKELGVKDFSDYLEQVFAFASEHEVQLDQHWHEDYTGTMGVEAAA